MLHVRDVTVTFSSYGRGLQRREQQVIQGLDLELSAGELLAVVGQSGAGKSLLAHALLGLLPANAVVGGEMRFKGQPLTPQRMRQVRGREIALIPQSVAYLNPLLSVGVQIARAARLGGASAAESRAAMEASLRRYRLAPEVRRWRPFQLSGGMARRVLTAAATIGASDLLLADEPTNGLDPAIAMESLQHLRALADSGKAVLLITHDIEAALQVADRVAVFCAGLSVELASSADFRAARLRHPYSRALWNALPGNGFTASCACLPDQTGMAGTGCPFQARCTSRQECCDTVMPSMRPVSGASGSAVRCHHG